MDGETYLPPVEAAFNNNCTLGCTVDGANNTRERSCTQSAGPSKGYYWSGSTYAPSPIVQPRFDARLGRALRRRRRTERR